MGRYNMAHMVTNKLHDALPQAVPIPCLALLDDQRFPAGCGVCHRRWSLWRCSILAGAKRLLARP